MSICTERINDGQFLKKRKFDKNCWIEILIIRDRLDRARKERKTRRENHWRCQIKLAKIVIIIQREYTLRPGKAISCSPGSLLKAYFLTKEDDEEDEVERRGRRGGEEEGI